MVQPIVLWSTGFTANPRKVRIILEELNIPYELKEIALDDVKKEPYEKLNPNGRLPTIQDPNTGITLWESGAILQYLIETYDKDHKLTYGDKKPEKYLEQQWLAFQISGQGPYWGQAAWFLRFHHEKVPSAVERYQNEMKRVMKVIDSHLAKTGTKYLVGDKCTFADLAWVPWDTGVGRMLGDAEAAKFIDSVPRWKEWHKSMMARASVKKIVTEDWAI